ncbi:peritrophin-1-like [Anopheles nili]|uniref:peritrophin-1-like n=1 Tax=Anopheles nili TaxID=185578 RepID=UPI00237C026D|nr:peritrophin-1-like [Anopheles nili]
MKSLVLLLALAGIAQLHGFKLCEEREPGAFVGNPANCSEFYMCRSGRPVLFTCPTDMYFDVDSASCGHEAFCAENELSSEEVAELSSGFTPIVAVPPRLEYESSICRGATPGKIRTDPKGCEAFYQCTKIAPLRFSCPAGTLFDSKRLVCEATDKAFCLVAPVTTAPPSHSSGSGGSSISSLLDVMCHGKQNGMKFSHPINCRQYFLCNGRDRAVLMNCPPGTAYHKTRKVCDFAQFVTC